LLVYLIYTASSFENGNGNSNKRYQERHMLILHLLRKKRLSKKTEKILVVDKQQQLFRQ
jgi:hypothetical protein